MTAARRKVDLLQGMLAALLQQQQQQQGEGAQQQIQQLREQLAEAQVRGAGGGGVKEGGYSSEQPQGSPGSISLA